MTQATSSQPRHRKNYDVIIIGAGIVGSMIARELCRYEGRFALLEKEPFSGFGVSKANPCMLHSPLMFPSGPLRTRLSHNAAARYQKLANELDVVFKAVDEIFLAFDSDQLAKLNTARIWADDNHVSAGHAIIGSDKIRQIEPNASQKAIGALYGKGVSGGIYATEWTFALAENAVQNGLNLYLNSPVTDIIGKGDFDFEVITPRGRFKTRYIINAAGLFVDEIARMVGDSDIQLVLTKGTMLILDKSASNLLGNMIYGTYGKDHSELVTPTAHGNLLIGLGYFSTPAHRGDTAVSRDKLQEVLHMGKKLVPAISEKDIITAFAGIRSENNMAAEGDFYIDHSKNAPGVIHAAIGSPGLTAAPAIAEYLITLLAAGGLRLEEKKTFNPNRTGWLRFETATAIEKHRLIEFNSKYGHMVCRCEQVSEAEVLEAIRRGADTMDAVKHVTRAGMGRCQGGFCGISVLNYLTQAQGVGPSQVTKKGFGSNQITGSKEEEQMLMSTVPETMKAAILMGRNHLKVKEVPTPAPGSMEVLLEVESCACCSTDVALMDKPLPGQPPYGNFTPGHEYAGIVAALGEGVDEFRVGDRVAVEAHLGCMRCKNCRVGNYTACLNYGTAKHRANGMTSNGGFAQYVINNINTVHPIPDHIDFNEAALITNLGCVLYGFETIGGYVAGNQVVVIGPGPLGLISSQVAKALGAEKVFLIGTRASRLSKGAETGADRLINIHEENAVEVILQETKGIGADLVVESSGASDAPMMAIKMAKPMGKILMLGMPHEPVLVDFEDLLLKNKSIHTVRGEGWSNVSRAVSLLGSGKVTLKPYVTHTFPLDEIDTAFETFVKRIDGAVKVVVKSNE